MTMGIRVTEEEEELGLDVTQHGERGYTSDEGGVPVGSRLRSCRPRPRVYAAQTPAPAGRDAGLKARGDIVKKIEAIIRPEKLNDVKQALDDLGYPRHELHPGHRARRPAGHRPPGPRRRNRHRRHAARR